MRLIIRIYLRRREERTRESSAGQGTEGRWKMDAKEDDGRWKAGTHKVSKMESRMEVLRQDHSCDGSQYIARKQLVVHIKKFLFVSMDY